MNKILIGFTAFLGCMCILIWWPEIHAYLGSFSGLYFGAFLALITGAFSVWYYYTKKVLPENRIRTWKENIYIVVLDPETGGEPNIPNYLKEFCFFCNYGDVNKTANWAKEMLLKVGNELYAGPKMKDHQKIQIRPLYFRYKERCNETYYGEENSYSAYLSAYIPADRAGRHIIIKEAKKDEPGWYEEHMLNESTNFNAI